MCLKKLLQNTPPEYLTLSLPRPRSAPAAAAYRRPKRTEEVSLAGVDAPRDYLSLSVTPSDNPKRRRGPNYVSGGGGSVAADASTAASTEGALVLVESAIRPPQPVQIPEACLPPKSRPGRDVSAGGGPVVVADASQVVSAEGALVLAESVIQPPPLHVRIPEACLPPKSCPGRDVSAAGGSVVADASPDGALVLVEPVIRQPPPLRIPEACLPPKKRKLAAAGFALATAVNHDDGLSASRSSWPPHDGATHSPETVAIHPIDAVPLQAVYVHGGVSHPFRLGSSTGEITTNETAEGQAKKDA
jgi:hypothetical protein